ncbi:CCHC-type domain-containing protein [Trichonephila inaurata madagascariensis]|uniref:CCHC-type domain-containing protein n=1 Tax=Trichonephila inaurata madagascariensis TaxID=2747483 RepID=A0A8X6WP71_9ARAC|nr:CCHC-type domain-containing protein [Trichonephila inaurata madagascariensis]
MLTKIVQKVYVLFIVPDRQFEFNKVPFGLSTSPGVFPSNSMFQVYLDLTRKGIVISYLDDSVIPAKRRKGRHCRVVFGVFSSPFLLGSTIQYHLEKKLEEAKQGRGKYPECIVQKLMRSFYVDNCLASVQTQSELDRFIVVATEIMSERKFELRGWEHSSPSHPIASSTNVIGTRRNDALEVGDVVLIGHDNVRRIDWPLGVVLEVYPGKDGVPLAVRIRTSHGLTGKASLPVEKTPESSTDHISDSPTDYVPASPVESTNNSEEKPPTKTRLGWTIKIPRKLDL